MAQHMALVSMCLVLMLGGTACAPKLVGPTPGAGYRFSLEVSEPIIWMGAGIFGGGPQLPRTSALIVRVQDAQGRPVDGVPVMFEVEPGWARSLSLDPSQTSTRGGIARATLSEPLTTGVVHVMARVDNVTTQSRLTVQRYIVPTAAGS
jgi:Bacterial Ig-like domain (group 1)